MNLARGLSPLRRISVRVGFTLIEVLLATVIITGLLVVVLFFYQQSAQLRTDLLVEAERISVARLLMDRITAELRQARRHNYFATPMVGDATSLQFITTALPPTTAWTGESYGRASRPVTDLKFVTYSTSAGEDATNVIGITRSEEPLVEFTTVASTEVFSSTFAVEETNSPAMLLTEQLRVLRFRYFDGAAWQDSWSDTRLPGAVEVTLASDVLPEVDELAEFFGDTEAVGEVFRRVIFLPGSRDTGPMVSSAATGDPAEELFP